MRKSRGFTLIEIMVTVAIVGILVAIFVLPPILKPLEPLKNEILMLSNLTANWGRPLLVGADAQRAAGGAARPVEPQVDAVEAACAGHHALHRRLQHLRACARGDAREGEAGEQLDRGRADAHPASIDAAPRPHAR